MDMSSHLPDWLAPVAWIYIALCLLSAVVIAVDIYLLRRRRPRGVLTELVWIAAALYLGPFAVWLHLRRGRAGASDNTAGATATSDGLLIGLLPGGSASAVAHLVSVPLVAVLGWTIAGIAMWPMMIVIAVVAIALLAWYERASGDTVHAGRLSVSAAIGVAVITVLAFDVGMIGWMLLLFYNHAMPPITDGAFWFLMQVGVIVGLATGYPAVKWHLRRNESTVSATAVEQR